MTKDRRGGDRVSVRNEGKKVSVMNFINTLKCSEPHYCATRTGRRYLPPELSIRKLSKMYNSTVHPDLKVKESYFRNIFNTKYNVGFGTPRVDVCSTCLQLDEKLKACTDPLMKNTLMNDKRIYKLRAKCFYELLKEKQSDTQTFSFDCQRNLPFPKLPDQATYYSRQLHLYNFTVVKGDSKSPLTPDNVTAYVWLENEFPKGSNEIASCVLHSLQNSDIPEEVTTIRLVCDGCGGQNKNSTLISMVCYWLVKFSPMQVKIIELVFPVTGHSFLPADRVFGLIEKKIRKIEIMHSPDQYIEIIKEHATVRKLGQDVIDLDFKREKDNFFKLPGKWNFKLQSCKRVYVKKIGNGKCVVKGEPFYRNSLSNFQSLLKPNKVLNVMRPLVIQKSNSTKTVKKENVDSLLKTHYGNNWREIDFLLPYIRLIDEADVENELNPDDPCEPVEEAPTYNI